MKMLKMCFVAMLSLAMFAGCGDDDSGGGDGVRRFKGTPANFDGYWTGKGSMTYQGQTDSNLDYTLVIQGTPNSLYLLMNAGGAIELEFDQLYTNGNDIFTVDGNLRVGSIGAEGFILSDPEMGELVIAKNSAGALVIDSYLLFEHQGTKEKMRLDFDATVVKSDIGETNPSQPDEGNLPMPDQRRPSWMKVKAFKLKK